MKSKGGLIQAIKARIASYLSGERRISFTSCVIAGAIVTPIVLLLIFHPGDIVSIMFIGFFGIIGGMLVGYVAATVLALFFTLRK